MGVGIARHGDRYDSFLCMFAPTLVTTTTKTYVNGLGIARLGDSNSHFHLWPGHGAVWLTGIINTASLTVEAEGIKVARIGDTLHCGSGSLGNCTIIEGSSDTFSG